jgi:hypothetical protein
MILTRLFVRPYPVALPSKGSLKFALGSWILVCPPRTTRPAMAMLHERWSAAEITENQLTYKINVKTLMMPMAFDIRYEVLV